VTGYRTSPAAGSGGGGDRPGRIDAYPGYFTIELKRNAKSVK
jgi:hypothetical protein